MSDSILLDGFGPLSVRTPESVSELAELIRHQTAAKQGLYPVGGGTKLQLGLVPSKSGVAVSLTRFQSVIDYPARDMTVTVQAGIRIAELQKVLGKEHQWLPIDIPQPELATLGGSLAANTSGPRRLSQGTLRDYVIGISFVSNEGLEIQGGGRVVKNVAGYDLMKLHVGALGTLGIITQVTLKVRPKPEASVLVAFGVGATAIGPTLDRLHGSKSRPVAIELLNREAAKRTGLPLPETDPWVILCGFEEKAETAAWQVQELKSELASAPVRDLRELPEPSAWAKFTELQSQPEAALTLKANLLPSAVAGFVSAASAAHPDAAIHAHAGNGIVYVHLPSETPLDRASDVLSTLAKLTTGGNANLIVTHCLSAWKSSLPIWGRDAGDRAVMRQVKRTLDPDDLFNPGRLWG